MAKKNTGRQDGLDDLSSPKLKKLAEAFGITDAKNDQERIERLRLSGARLVDHSKGDQ